MATNDSGQGIVARALAAVRYTITGDGPAAWFGPLQPLPPQAPPEVRGRQFDYPMGVNLNYRPRGGAQITFDRLKFIARHPVVAMLIQRQKDKVASMDWQIKPRIDTDNPAEMKGAISTLTDFFTYPDKEHDWCQWIGGVLDQLMVIDAVTIYGAPTKGGDIYALQMLDGAVITPMLGQDGRRPAAPDVAYQQILKGLPAVDYTADELIYFPQTYRPDHIYGYSRVEQAVDLIEMAISRLRSQKGYFDFGNVGDGYFTAPEAWAPDQVKALESQWNSLMTGSVEMRREVPFLPMGTEWHPTKVSLLEDTFDEWLVRLLCFPFGVAPQPFMKQTGLGKGSSGTEHDAAEEGGVAPLMQYVQRLMNLILMKFFNRPDLEFSFVEDREFDPQIKATIEDLRLRNGSLTLNEVRDRNGEPPIEGGDVPMIYLPTGPVTVEEAIKPPEPPPPALVHPGLPGGPPLPGAPGGALPPPAKTDPPDPAKTFEKAADAGAELRLGVLLAAYLKRKAEQFCAALDGKMGKAMGEEPAGFDETQGVFDGFDWDWADADILIRPILVGVATTAGTDAVSTLGIFDPEILKKIAAISSDHASERAAEMVGRKWVDGALVDNPNPDWTISDATRTMLKKTISVALEEGQSSGQLKATIVDSYEFSKARAETIARTEVNKAHIGGTLDGWKQSDVVAGKQFLAAPDCCDECQACDGEIVGLDEEFSNGDPPVHPNCRCTVLSVLKDLDADTEADDDSTEGGEDDD